jgi:putative phosphoesterase
MDQVKIHRKSTHKTVQVHVREDQSLKLVVVADTHSAPHTSAMEIIAALHPDAILHAGDIGEKSVLDELATICPVYAVCGNIDERNNDLPDTLIIEIVSKDVSLLKIFAAHVGVYGSKLRAEVARTARNVGAQLVICGHSHVPFIGNDRGIIVFNPGSMGPQRNGLPIVFGVLTLCVDDYRLHHIDCQTGKKWEPPRFR